MKNDSIGRTMFVAAALLMCGVVGVGGCGGTKLKPIPVLYKSGKVDFCSRVPEAERTRDVKVFYASNRAAKGPADNRKYTNSMGERLHLGVATVQMGDKNTSWEDICRASTAQGDANPSFRFVGARELGTFAKDDAAAADAFVEAINQQLQQGRSHEVNIYVHGFRTSFSPEGEILAKLQHFLARGGAAVLFAWPSRQNLLLYGGDVERGRKSAHHLADLIELIASRTNAESINVLAYSAGAVATSEALSQLRDRYPNDDAAALSKRLHVGNVIFAASDLDLKVFAKDQLKRIQDIGQNTIIYISNNDAALGWASLGYGASRLGRPDVKKLNLSKADIEQAAKDTSLQIVDVSDVKGPHSGLGGIRGHGYWYTNDWIMTDLLVVLRWQATAAERGLVQKPGKARWFFPKDYPTRIYDAVNRLAERPTTMPTTAPTKS